MKLHLSEQAYQWPGGVGKLVLDEDGELVEHVVLDCVLVSHFHTRELEFVPEWKIKPYPRTPIEEPTK